MKLIKNIPFIILLFVSCSSNKALKEPYDLFSLSPRDSVRIETWSNKSISGIFKQEKKGTLFVLTKNELITVKSDSVKSIKIVKKAHPKPTIGGLIFFTLFAILMVGIYQLSTFTFGD